MRHRAVCSIVLLAAALFASSCIVRSSLSYYDKDTEGVPNLLSNPSFNAYSFDPDNALLGWSIHTDGNFSDNHSVFIDGRQSKQGKTSLRVDASNKTVTILSDAFTVKRYGGFYSRVYACSSEPKGPQITVRFITFRENGTVYSKFKTKLKTGLEWEKGTISAGFLRPGVNFGRLQIIIPPFSKGSVWLDDAGCWEVHHFRID